MWPQFPVDVYIDVSNPLVRDRIQDAIGYWRAPDESLIFRESTQPVSVGVRVVCAARDQRGHVIRGAMFAWEECIGGLALFRRGIIFLHPHAVPHRIDELISHELGHALGFPDEKIPNRNDQLSKYPIMQPRAFVGKSWHASEYGRVYELGVGLLQTDPREASQLLGRAVELASVDLADQEALARAYQMLSMSYRQLGDTMASRECLIRAEALTSDIALRAHILHGLAGCTMDLDGLRSAFPFFRKGRNAARESGDRIALSITYTTLAIALPRRRRLWRQRFSRAGADLATEAARRSPEDETRRAAVRAQILALVEEAAFDEAEQVLAAASWLDQKYPLQYADLYFDVAVGLARHRKFPSSLRPAIAAADRFKRFGATQRYLDTLIGIAWTHRALRQWNDAFVALAQAQHVYSDHGAPTNHARFSMIYRDFCSESGQHQRWTQLHQNLKDAEAILDAQSRDEISGEIEARRALFDRIISSPRPRRE